MVQRLRTEASHVVFAAGGIVVALDLATKWLASDRLRIGEDHWLLDGVLGLELIHNRGVAFGLLQGRSLTVLLVLVALLALVWLIVVDGDESARFSPIAAGLMLGGALGNLIDRAPDGAVTDFVALGPWPRFNLADAALTLGVALLLLQQLRLFAVERRSSLEIP